MKHVLTSLMMLVAFAAFAQTTTLYLTIDGLTAYDPSDGFSIQQIELAFSPVPDFQFSMGLDGDEQGDYFPPTFSFDVIPLGVMTTNYLWDELLNVPIVMNASIICGADTVILAPVILEGELDDEGNMYMEEVIVVACGTPADFDCPDLMANYGDACQGGWGIVDENCDCVEYQDPCAFEINVEQTDEGELFTVVFGDGVDESNPAIWEWYIDGLLTGPNTADGGLLVTEPYTSVCAEVVFFEGCNGVLMECYEIPNCLTGNNDAAMLLICAISQCGDPDNPEQGMWCDLIETLDLAYNSNDAEACAEVINWMEANDWDGNCDNGGNNDFDCPELGGNIGDPCTTADGNFGIIFGECECVEVSGCDLEVETNLVAIDDGTGSGIVEAIVTGGTPPYTYEWTDFFDVVYGTEAVLEGVSAGTYFLQVMDANGCPAFGWEDVPMAWDCPNMMANFGDPCQGGWGIVDEDCDCIQDPGECAAEFTVAQAYSGNELIPYELFVFIWGYDENNTYSWDFGDEGTSDEPFTTWTYGTDGPYNLCLTVSNEELGCTSTSCQWIEVDSLGWINGFMNGFSITILNGEEGVVNGFYDGFELPEYRISPNPVLAGSFSVQWSEAIARPVDYILYAMDGKEVLSIRQGEQTGRMQAIDVSGLAPGLYLCHIRNGFALRTEKIIIK
ncbi:MAG: T9SS type A sorting domain-containing protein [Flavobacteriales bacterium]